MRALGIFVGLGLLAVGAACELATDPAYEEEVVKFTGHVAAVSETSLPGGIAKVLVLHPEKPVPYDKRLVHLLSSTEIVRVSASGKNEAADVSSLTAGMVAEFVTRIEGARSYPEQLIAVRVVIRETRQLVTGLPR